MRISIRKSLLCLCSIFLAALPIFAGMAGASNKTRHNDRLKNCGTVLREILDVPDDIPRDVLDKADCVIVFPSVLKASRRSGGTYGRGAMSCRQGNDFKDAWGAPAMVRLDGGSFGWQIHGKNTDLVLLVMDEGAAKGVLKNKVKLGADASAAAGPVGRDSSTGAVATRPVQILSYSRARGLFAGVSLDGSTIRPDNGGNRRLYGRKVPAIEIALSGVVAVPEEAEEMISALGTKTLNHGA
jgi:lipid-binding SYLF domain-containing protein